MLSFFELIFTLQLIVRLKIRNEGIAKEISLLLWNGLKLFYLYMLKWYVPYWRSFELVLATTQQGTILLFFFYFIF